MAGSTYIVSSGVFSGGIELNEKDYLYVLSGGANSAATVNSGGVLAVSRGGYDYGTTVNSDGVLHDFGYVGNATIGDGALAYIYNGGSANNFTVKSNGEVVVLAGGSMLGGSVASDGGIVVSAGATVESVRVSSGGYIQINLASNTVFSGTSNGSSFNYRMFASGITLDKTKDLNLYNNASANDLRVNLNGELNVYSGGSANIIEVTNGGQVDVYDGGMGNRIDIKSGGNVAVRQGGYVEGTAVSGGSSGGSRLNGVLEVSGSAYRTVVHSAGLLKVTDQGNVASSIISSGGSIYVEKGGNALKTNVGSSCLIVINGGVAQNTQVGWRGSMNVSSGGSATGTVLTSSSYMAVAAGGSSIDFTADTGARFGVHVAQNTYLSGTSSAANGSAAAVLLENGLFKDLTYSGNLWVHNSGVAENLTVISGSGVVYNGGSAADVTLQEVKMTVSKGGVMTGTEVHSAGSLTVLSGASVKNAVVSSGGEMYVRSSGAADGVTVASNAQLYVSNGAATGKVTVKAGGFVNGIKVLTDNVYSGTVNLSGALVSHVSNSLVVAETALLDGAHNVTDLEVRYGALTLANGADASSVNVNSAGLISAVGSGVVLDAVKVNQSGLVILDVGAVGKNVEITSGGIVEAIYQGALENSQVSDGGIFYVVSGGIAEAVNVVSGGAIAVDGTGKLLNVVAEAGADVNGFILNEQNVYSGTLSVVNAAAGSDAMLDAGQIASQITIGNGAFVVVGTNAMLADVTVGVGGSLQVDHGAVLTGQITLEDRINALGGSMIVFDVRDQLISSQALINDLALVYGAPEYSILVDALQGNGTYKLADNAKNFFESLTIRDAEAVYGEITVNGRAFYHHDVTFRLENIADKLTLTVSGAPTYMVGDFDGSGQDMWVVSNGSQAVFYSNGELWKSVDLGADKTILGVGDFNNDGISDLLLKDDSQGIYAGFGDGSGNFELKMLGSRTENWRMTGIGDFDNDGFDDVMFANDKPTSFDEAAQEELPIANGTLGMIGYWDLGLESNNWALVGGFENSWEIIATGDFNGDGTTDMLWKNNFIGEGSSTYNSYCSWSMNTQSNPQWQMVSVADPLQWKFLTVGDFNGDSVDDIAMINGDGVVGVWTMQNGTAVDPAGNMIGWTIMDGIADPDQWILAGVGDFNGDGTDDIAWSNVETGLSGYWQIKDNKTQSWNVIANLA